MIKLYMCDVSRWLGCTDGRQGLEELAQRQGVSLPKLDPGRYKRCVEMKHEDSAVRSLAAGILLQYALTEEGLPEGQRRIAYAGKPMAVGSGYEVSLSHSGDYVVCGIATFALGVDVQRLEILEPSKYGRVFPAEENHWICSVSKEEGLDRFYQLWTRKESYFKWSQDEGYLKKDMGLAGEGMAGKGYCFHELRFVKGEDAYRLCLCRENSESCHGEHSPFFPDSGEEPQKLLLYEVSFSEGQSKKLCSAEWD